MRVLALSLGLFVAVGCGELERPVSPSGLARAELVDRGIAYTVASFVDAAAAGDLAVVELFVAAGMWVDTAYIGGWTAQHLAARNGHLAVVEYLAGQGASVVALTEHGNTVLDLAEQGGHTRIVSYLVEQGGKPAARAALARRGIAYTAEAFIAAAQYGNMEVVRLFIEAGMPVDTADRMGFTAKDWAALDGQTAMAEYLESQGG